MTSRWQGALLCFKGYGGELVSKTAIVLTKSWGGATAVRLHYFLQLFVVDVYSPWQHPRGVMGVIYLQRLMKVFKNERLVYHAAYKDEYRPFNLPNSHTVDVLKTV